MKKMIELIENYLSNENVDKAEKIINKITNKMYFNYYQGEIKRIKGLINQSKHYYKKALFQKNKNHNLAFDCILKLISIYRSEGNIKEAANLIKKARRMGVKDRRLNLEIAMYYRMKGDFKKAETEFKKLTEYYIQIKDNQGISYVNWALGGIYRLIGDFKKSISSYIKAVRYANKSQDISLKIYGLLGLAGVLRVSGNVNASYETYLKVYKLVNSNDYFAKAYVYCGMANALRQKGDIKNALINYKKSYKLYKKIGDELDLALVLWGIGECYKRNGKFYLALDTFKKADALFKKGFEPRGIILNRISMSHTLYLIGKKNEARKVYFDALSQAKKHSLNTYLEIFT